MPALTLRVPEALEARLDREASLEGVPRSEIVRDAIEEFLARRERNRLVDSYVQESRALYGNSAGQAEALALAEEALPFDNEALDRSTRPPPRPARRQNRR
jgi:metal-responsive CopG/Arc/MetJ family transcriptional regulator